MSGEANLTEAEKPCHTIVLDSSPLLLNTPSISTLLSNSQSLVTTPSVVAEIKDEAARSRVDTLYKPFLTLKSPKPESVKFVKDFARKTGDGTVLSQTDYDILALTYELECERNGGDWRLRNTPGQKRINGKPPVKAEENADGQVSEELKEEQDEKEVKEDEEVLIVGNQLEGVKISSDDQPPAADEPIEAQQGIEEQFEDTASSSDSEGWITPSNIKKHKAKDSAANSSPQSAQPTLQVACITGDFAMQNMLLQIGLNLLSTSTCKRISNIRQFILRCHACFQTTKDTSKQFCPRCGKPTLTRVSCTTNDKGEVKLHLKKNMQWNNRGNVYSIPKPVTGNAHGRWQGPRQGGGKGGWGSDLILAEDQKEYVKAMSRERRLKAKDLMDEDVLPGILSGDRGFVGGKPRIGAGRNVNSKKR